MKNIVYYVSGHGYGHARRAAAIMRAITHADPAARIVARTSAPASIFAGIERVRVDPPAYPLDFGAAEIDAMHIDVAATLRNAATILDLGPRIIAEELAYLRAHDAAMVVADIPFIIGQVVRTFRADGQVLPAVAVGNFTWDWIYAPYLAANPSQAFMGPAIRDAYSHFDVCLRLPLAHPMECFGYLMDVPLVIQPKPAPADETLRRIGCPVDSRPRVLIAMRGGLFADTIRKAVAGSPHCLFLAMGKFPTGMTGNIHAVPAGIDFTDLLAASDVAVSKLGYGLVADAIACEKALVWPARKDFREDEIFRQPLTEYVRQAEISREDLLAGNWRAALDAAIAAPPPPKRMAMDGAAVCADEILCRILR